jgi:SulP family sulfate permease
MPAALLTNLRIGMNLAHFADFCTAWRSCIREGLSANRLFRDTIAGIVVGAISLPLSITFAISSGMSPQAGLYTAIIGGLVAGIFGGSKYQISGPTAAFIVILIPIVREFGPAGLMITTAFAGVILLLLGLLRLGKLIDFISFPVIAGFTLGIAISVMILQLRSFCGIIAPLTNSTCNEFIAVFTHWENCNAADLILGMFTLGSLFGWSYFVKNIPAALVVLPISCVLGVILPTIDPSFHFETIANHFTTVVDGIVYHGIPPIPPRFEFPWKLHDGMHLLDSFAGLMSLFKGAFTIAVLCAIETLVTAVCGDRLTATRSNANGELISQGLANIASPFFGGFSVSGAIPRTAANIQAGGSTPWASFVHSAFLLASILFFSRYLGYLPLSAMAALLIYVAYFMSDVRGCVDILRTAQREEWLTMLLCAVLTILFDMVTAIAAGVVLTAITFMYRMSEMSATKEGVEGSLQDEESEKNAAPIAVPEGILYFKVKGALFFGSASRLTSEIHPKEGAEYAVIDLSEVPLMDSTGISQLMMTVKQLLASGLIVSLTGLQPIPRSALRAAKLGATFPEVRLFRTNAEAFRILLTPISKILPLGHI